MRNALIICPEAPYPVSGGGQLRSTCMLEYLASRYSLDVIVFHEPETPDPRAAFPRGLVRNVQVVELPFHSKFLPIRAARNLLRYYRNLPPMIDRFGGFPLAILRDYEVAVIEHFWCAPYVNAVRPFAKRIVLDLHNIDSVLLQRSAATQGIIGRTLLQKFATASAWFESELLPQFDLLLATSETDRATVGSGAVWPNTIPELPQPNVAKRDEIVFSGNMAYQPNSEAVHHFSSVIWPLIRKAQPSVTWRLAGKHPEALRLPKDRRVRITGPMEHAVPEIAAARAAVVPLLSGSGTRFKIIEAWAAGTPVISTTIGAEGLDATHGEHLLIADTPAEFSAAVIRVLNDTNLADRLSSSGRAFYEANFTWPRAWKMLEAVGL